jgi:hypothetical protein
VAQELLYFSEWPPLHREPTCEGMPQVVKVKILEPSALAGAQERRPDARALEDTSDWIASLLALAVRQEA